MSAAYYLAFCLSCITVLKEFNQIVTEPYMDEPFHIPQAQAYCRGEWNSWDPKITTPPGLYVVSLIMKRVFMFKCTLPMLRLSTMLALLVLPLVVTHLICFHQRRRAPTSVFTPTAEAVILSGFPIAWFFGFMYYTEVPSLVAVVSTVVASSKGRHWLAGLLGLISCTFRQTNIVWVLYAYAASQLMHLRFRRARPGEPQLATLHDPPAAEATFADLLKAVMTAPTVIMDILPSFTPYGGVIALFGAFVVWNRGIVLGDKSNHIPSLHVPQLYYFLAFSTFMGWPVLASGPRGTCGMIKDVWVRMFGSSRRTAVTALLCVFMSITVNLFTIHHPFLLSDNRHYTFYVWRRMFTVHPAALYVFVPGYIACGWAWFLRVSHDQTILQTLILPVFVLPTLLPTPLLEPRYFLIPYVLLRAQVSDASTLGLVLEGAWYAAINAATMYMFLYMEREGVGRFMW